jgi:hypothetical protein
VVNTWEVKTAGGARRLLVPGLCLASACVLGGCGGSHPRAIPTATATSRILAYPGKTQSARVSLPLGRTSAHFGITAPDPARYAFNVVTAAPTTTAFSVEMRTWYGAVFSIYDSADYGSECRQRSGRRTCLGRFPLLPAQRAGAWTVVVSKRSAAAATIAVAVTFARP